MSDKKKIEEGWAKPGKSRKFHYFRGVRCLCGGWLFFGSLDKDNPKADNPQNDCAKCSRKRKKEREVLDE